MFERLEAHHLDKQSLHSFRFRRIQEAEAELINKCLLAKAKESTGDNISLVTAVTNSKVCLERHIPSNQE